VRLLSCTLTVAEVGDRSSVPKSYLFEVTLPYVSQSQCRPVSRLRKRRAVQRVVSWIQQMRVTAATTHWFAATRCSRRTSDPGQGPESPGKRCARSRDSGEPQWLSHQRGQSPRRCLSRIEDPIPDKWVGSRFRRASARPRDSSGNRGVGKRR